LLIATVALSSLRADIVVLSNGDRVSGTVLESDGKVLKLKSEFMGEVEVAWAAIIEIRSDEKLFLSSTDGQVLVGPVTTTADQFSVETEQSGTVTVPKSEVAAVRNQQAQEDYLAEIEQLRDPSLLDFWSGFFDTGYSMTAGNAETRSFTNSARAQRKTERDKITAQFTSVLAKNSTAGESETTANAIRGGTRYDINLNEKVFTFAFVDLEFDKFQGLDLRNVVGGGMGWHIKDSEKVTFDFFSGGSFNQEFFDMEESRRSGELVFGEELGYDFSARSSWSQRFAIYPNLQQTGDYRMQFDSSLASELLGWLGWHVTFSDRFVSNPAVGREKNDVLLTTGLRISFGNE
jgi:putative salt-induced outer membrane protein YdiY